jgi:hypothetical protein
MRENELGPLGKVGITVLVAAWSLAAVANIVGRRVAHPQAFWIVVAGLLLFLVGKVSVIARGRWMSFGSWPMSEGMANAYRVGYWLMAVGILFTFT